MPTAAATEKTTSKFPPLDPQAQLALLLMEQQKQRRRRKERKGDADESSSSSSSSDEDLKVSRSERQPRRVARFGRSRIVDTLTKDQSTQTVVNPMADPTVLVVDAVYSSDRD